MDLGLSGKNVLLFGGNGAIGLATSLAFAREGANIMLASRDVATSGRIADEAKTLGSRKALAVKTDAAKWEDVEAAVKKMQEEFGSIDICYHGVAWDRIAGFFELDPGDWDRIIEVNFKSVLIAMKIILPIMKAQAHGSFVVMSSVMARMPTPVEPVYGAVKAGLISLVHTLATEMGQFGVRINVVAPGPTPADDPELVSAGSCVGEFMKKDKEAFALRQKQRAAVIPLRKVGRPDDSAYAVLFLASDVTGGHQTGQVIGVDGGWYMPH
jgi:NAD(P)-dependent dehydrogenase (short-subunit alcohol dehydrogenase family)